MPPKKTEETVKSKVFKDYPAKKNCCYNYYICTKCSTCYKADDVDCRACNGKMCVYLFQGINIGEALQEFLESGANKIDKEMWGEVMEKYGIPQVNGQGMWVVWGGFIE